MKTIFLVEWTSKESLNAGRHAWRVHEAYITQEAAQARAKELNAEDTKDIHRVTSTVLNQK